MGPVTREAIKNERRDGRAHESVGTRGLAEITPRAKEHFEALTGMPVETVSGASRDEEGWRLAFEVLELSRIPDSTSLLGSYDVVVDADGEIVEYGRRRRYYRNRADEEDM